MNQINRILPGLKARPSLERRVNSYEDPSSGELSYEDPSSGELSYEDPSSGEPFKRLVSSANLTNVAGLT
jgi:hypothetical protein